MPTKPTPEMHRKATIAEVANSVLSSDAANTLKAAQVHGALDIALRTVIGLNCLGGHTLDIDQGNGHVLHCSLKRVVGPTDV
ncbi:MAG: hypothetical protein QM569_14755 [Acidovorax sp.]|uniref:hypothetical protein n=1 Tax=Acidovorax sp. TaxID=1872122 RepID=UPI0039E6AB8D